jgi:hypothetical protein
MLVLLLGVVGWLVSGLSSAKLEIDRDKQTADALARAKEALIGRAATDDNRPGSLPCPDLVTNIVGNVPNDGNADLLSGNDCPSYLGRLPWRTLGLPDLRDGSGERLWYALSNTFRDDTSAQPINSDTPGQLVLTGISPATGMVALVFAPGTALGSQVRDLANENAPGNYLEGENANGPPNYVSGTASDTFNDKLITLSSVDLFSVVEKRVVKEVEAALRFYYTLNSNYLPAAASFTQSTCLGSDLKDPFPFPGECSSDSFVYEGRIPANPTPGWTGVSSILRGDSPPSWFHANLWRELVYYAVTPSCTLPLIGCPGAGGTLTLNDPPGPPIFNQKVVVIVAGTALVSQASRASDKTNVMNYFESENSDANPFIYTKGIIGSTFNDRPVSVASIP